MSGRALCRLDITAADRIAKLLGMFSSNHDGEIVNAARMADKFVKQLGLTWRDVIRPANDVEPAPQPQPKRAPPRWRDPCTVEEGLEVAHRYRVALSEWECGFVRDLRRKRAWRLSEKQCDILGEIIEKCRVHAMAEAA